MKMTIQNSKNKDFTTINLETLIIEYEKSYRSRNSEVVCFMERLGKLLVYLLTTRTHQPSFQTVVSSRRGTEP